MPASGHPLHAIALISQPLGTPLVAIAAYLVVLVTMLVLGVFMGWDRTGQGGRGGTRRPPVRQPDPDDGGRPQDPAEPWLAGHLAAWESQLDADGDLAKTPDQEDAPVGTS